ncbi:NAD-binding protein [Sulfurimonas sp.]|jgi:voltage-gated potassium channel|uniref:NAD-binding protein n=1 Tax=Sulfurimonas sp. TaxID=2022749 RepID=UPI0025F3D135|nr:NAD-binding protein [Sulfurimonas sp.]MBT5934652.1 potassium transporter TrkA [Sulfurimonas sp.]
MSKTTALIFGFNKYALEIELNVKVKYDNIKIYSLNKQDIDNSEKNVEYFDLNDEWSSIENCIDMENSIAFCALEDSAENIFLTISLRAHFKELIIIAIASNKESANKLTMAGANKVIPLVETTADIIANVLEKPISNKVLHNILYEESALKVEQVKIANEEYFENASVSDIDWSGYNGIIILSVMKEDMSHEFIYASKLKNHIIKNGDILVVVGFETDIEEFKNIIGSN